MMEGYMGGINRDHGREIPSSSAVQMIPALPCFFTESEQPHNHQQSCDANKKQAFRVIRAHDFSVFHSDQGAEKWFEACHSGPVVTCRHGSERSEEPHGVLGEESASLDFNNLRTSPSTPRITDSNPLFSKLSRGLRCQGGFKPTKFDAPFWAFVVPSRPKHFSVVRDWTVAAA